MRYLEGKSKLESEEPFTVEEIKSWINEASKHYSFFDAYLRGKNKSKKLLVKNFENIVKGLSFHDKYDLLVYNSFDIPDLNFKANQLILKMLDEHLKENTELTDIDCLVKCFKIAYPEDKNKKLDESEKDIKDYLESNFDKVIDKILIEDYYELMYSLKNASRLDEFLNLFRQNYGRFLDNLNKYGMLGISDFSVTNEQLYGLLSGKFKEFFDNLHNSDEFERFILRGNFFRYN